MYSKSMQTHRHVRALSQTISKKIDKGIFEYRVISPGDRVLVGVSGGKDSTTLLFHLGRKAGKFSIPFELTAFHLETEYEDPRVPGHLNGICEGLGVPLLVKRVRPAERLREGRSMSCYWCATQRRTELLSAAMEHGFTKIALGHHLEDFLETFFMNFSRKKELSTMLPVMSYRKYTQSVIRPLVWVREAETRAFADLMGFPVVRCSCGFDSDSRRKTAREVVEHIAELEGDGVRERMLEALHNPRLRYLIRRATEPSDDVGRGHE